jgi:hypothetical protein
MITKQTTKWSEDGSAAIRAATNAFQDYPAAKLGIVGVPAVAVSIYLESEMHKRSQRPSDLVERWGLRYGVAAMTAGDVRRLEQGIVRWPKPDHPEHGMIFCLSGPKKSNNQSRNLARQSTILIPPPSS